MTDRRMRNRTLQERGQPLKSAADLQACLRNTVQESTTPYGVFGMKLNFNQFQGAVLNGTLTTDAGACSLGGFRKYIFVYHSDKIARAISAMLAREANNWNTQDVALAHGNARPLDPEDAASISCVAADCVFEENGWRRISSALTQKASDPRSVAPTKRNYLSAIGAGAPIEEGSRLR